MTKLLSNLRYYFNIVLHGQGPKRWFAILAAVLIFVCCLAAGIPNIVNILSPSFTPNNQPILISGPTDTAVNTPMTKSTNTPRPTKTTRSTITPEFTVIPTPTETSTPLPSPTIEYHGAEIRVGSICKDGSTSDAMGRGACSNHGGVAGPLLATITPTDAPIK